MLKGYYQVALDLREIPRDSGHWVLGLERTPWTDDDDDDDDDARQTDLNPERRVPCGKALPTDWVKLIDNVNALEIANISTARLKWVGRTNGPIRRTCRTSCGCACHACRKLAAVRNRASACRAAALAKVIPTSRAAGRFRSGHPSERQPLEVALISHPCAPNVCCGSCKAGHGCNVARERLPSGGARDGALRACFC